MSSIPSSGIEARPFVQASYLDGEVASVILDCPFGRPGEPCSVTNHCRRHRKTGPTHPVAVLRCSVHERYFTAYPEGFVPYARRQIVDGPVQHDVPALVDVLDETVTSGARPRRPACDTGSWSTQGRLLDRLSKMFGLHDLDAQILVAAAFGLLLTDLRAAARTNGCRARATALLTLRQGLCADDLLALGALTGCWGRPHRWLPDRDQLLPLTLARGPPTNSGRGGQSIDV